MSTGMLVLSILLAVALIQAVIWTLVLRTARRRTAAQRASLEAELARHPEERVLRGPVRARVRRGRVSSQCMLALTDERLLASGAELGSIALADIATVKSNAWFNGEYRSGYEWLIISTNDEAQVGFLCMDSDSGWPNAVREAMPQRNSLLPNPRSELRAEA